MENKKEGCNTCVHSESKWGWVEGKYTCIERTCKLGNTDKLYKWWEDNGKKIYEPRDIMECHDFPETTKILNRINERLDKIIEIFDDKNSLD